MESKIPVESRIPDDLAERLRAFGLFIQFDSAGERYVAVGRVDDRLVSAIWVGADEIDESGEVVEGQGLPVDGYLSEVRFWVECEDGTPTDMADERFALFGSIREAGEWMAAIFEAGAFPGGDWPKSDARVVP